MDEKRKAERIAANSVVVLVDELIEEARPSRLSRHSSVVTRVTLERLAAAREGFAGHRLGHVLADGIHEVGGLGL